MDTTTFADERLEHRGGTGAGSAWTDTPEGPY